MMDLPIIEVKCVFCERPMTKTEINSGYIRAKTWVHMRKRDQGGAHTFVLRQDLNEHAHEICIDLAKVGRHGQNSLF